MSLIHWTDITANPIHIVREDGSNGGHFCNKVSPGCLHCFSEAQNQSNYFSFASHLPYAGKAPKNLIFDDVVMEKLLRMRSGKKVFLCSMTDLFGEWVPDEWIDKAFVFMLLAQQHTFQILTKRPQRMQHYLSDPATIHRVTKKASDLMNLNCLSCWPLPNVWVGTSIENQEMLNKRAHLLLKTPAAIRFFSCEPLLEALEISSYISQSVLDTLICPSVDWVIIGGESGSKSRPCHSQWIESLVTQCQQQSVAVFVKQLGQNVFIDNALLGVSYKAKLKDRKGGDMAEWPESLRVRQFPIAQN